METMAIWMVLFPFIGAALLGILCLLGIRLPAKVVGVIASATMFLSFVQALRIVGLFLPGGGVTSIEAGLLPWISLPGMMLEWTLRLDALSCVLCLVVTGVGTLIHVYSIGYMEHDDSPVRYFSYLNLFCGLMLVLVTGSSLPLMFLGWEGVGLCSYLLIGFWFKETKNAAAGRKAFVVNRIGDAGFLLAMLLTYTTFGSLEIQRIVSHPALSTLAGSYSIEMICLLFFIGCVGKSAQFPLYVWLPDAMAGPTPVSALIHAATMVTAGVYLIARLSFLFALAPLTSQVVATTGAFTALFAATIAATQTDIKKVLAFSTVSQLGFMVLAMGVGAYREGIFHLVTHAFFKALLFMAAGSIIHALNGEQDMSRMGGLKNYLVGTTLVFICGAAAIVGIPGTSGWFSKDAILYEVLASGRIDLFVMALLAALFTAFYMTRMFYRVFLGVPRAAMKDLQSVHEAPTSMMYPMWALAGLSILGGIFSLKTFLPPVLAVSIAHEGETFLSERQLAWAITLLSLVVAGVTYQYFERFDRRPGLVSRSAKGSMYSWVARQYGFDRFMMFLGGPVTRTLALLFRTIDERLIDHGINEVGVVSRGVASAFSRLQGGWLQLYAVAMGLGSVLLVWAIMSGGAH